MFERILLPLPSEYFPVQAAKRAITLAEKFKSKLYIDYIFEEQVLDKVNNVSSGVVPQCTLEEMGEEVKNVEVGGESTVLFDRIEQITKKKNIDLMKVIHSGQLTDEILDCVHEYEINLIVTEFHSDTLPKYKIFYKSPIPIWLENNGNKLKKIYGILTNLSPNEFVPKAAFYLSKRLNIPLHFYYVLDTSEMHDERTEYDTHKRLIKDIKARAKKLNIYFEYDTVTQDISHFLDHTFRNEDDSLVILGRFKKPVKLPFTTLDKKIEVSKKLGANVLLLR